MNELWASSGLSNEKSTIYIGFDDCKVWYVTETGSNQLWGIFVRKTTQQVTILQRTNLQIRGKMPFARDSIYQCKRKRIANPSLYTRGSIKWKITTTTWYICLEKKNVRPLSIGVICTRNEEYSNQKQVFVNTTIEQNKKSESQSWLVGTFEG